MGMLIDVDLDWLNDKRNPVRSLKSILQHLPPDTPAVLTIEHHHILKHIRQWIQSGIIMPPFDIIHIDQHHDFYFNNPPHHPEGRGINCGNWGFRIPLWWYNSFTWIPNRNPDTTNWEDAMGWLTSHKKRISFREKLRGSSWKPIVATFCVSPDYSDKNVMSYMDQLIDVIVQYFGLQRAPRPRPDYKGFTEEVEAWQRVACHV